MPRGRSGIVITSDVCSVKCPVDTCDREFNGTLRYVGMKQRLHMKKMHQDQECPRQPGNGCSNRGVRIKMSSYRPGQHINPLFRFE